MPIQVENCVLALMRDWGKDPTKRPKPKDPKQNAKSQAFAICTAQFNKSEAAEDAVKSLDDGIGPTILGAALTNRPFMKGMPPIQVIEEDGKKYLTIPLLRIGRFKHEDGVLDFRSATYESMINNFRNNALGVEIALDNRHKPELGAAGWFRDVYVKDAFLFTKVEPTTIGLSQIEGGLYKYASIEFHPDWVDPKITFSADDLTEVIEEEQMPDTITTVSLEEHTTMLNEKIRLEEALRAERARVTELEAQTLTATVERIVLQAEARRDSDGRAHPPLLIDWAKKVLLLQDVGDGTGVIKLEDRDNVKNMRAYVRQAVAWLLESLPGVVPLDKSQTRGENGKSITAEDVDDSTLKTHAKNVWEM